MSRYRKIEVRTWGDEKFRGLSQIPACGQGLWFFLLTGPHTGPIPGLFRAGRAAMAEELDWELEAFDEAFREVSRKGMAKADFKAKVVWIPNAIRHNKPESPNVVRSWSQEFDLIPECALKQEALESLRAFICGLGEAFTKAFDEAFGKPSPKTMANQEQEQEQEQEQDKNGLPPQPLPKPLPKPAPTIPSTRQREPIPKRSKPADKSESKSGPVWNAYAAAYFERYHVEPVRNAKVNSVLAKLVDRLGAEDAPFVAEFFVNINARYYIERGHSVDVLLADAEKLRTQWATGRVVTSTQAQQADRTQTNANLVDHLTRKFCHDHQQ